MALKFIEFRAGSNWYCIQLASSGQKLLHRRDWRDEVWNGSHLVLRLDRVLSVRREGNQIGGKGEYCMLWCDVMWCDVMWCDVMWCDVLWWMWCDVMGWDGMWCDVMWFDLMWLDVMWCNIKSHHVMWCDAMWCDMMWCDVMWCDVMWRDVGNVTDTISWRGYHDRSCNWIGCIPVTYASRCHWKSAGTQFSAATINQFAILHAPVTASMINWLALVPNVLPRRDEGSAAGFKIISGDH